MLDRYGAGDGSPAPRCPPVQRASTTSGRRTKRGPVTRPVLAVDAPRTLAGVAFAGLWLADRLAALAPSVVVTSTTHGPNEDAARYAYACGIRLALYRTSGRITGTTDAGRWTPGTVSGPRGQR